MSVWFNSFSIFRPVNPRTLPFKPTCAYAFCLDVTIPKLTRKNHICTSNGSAGRVLTDRQTHTANSAKRINPVIQRRRDYRQTEHTQTHRQDKFYTLDCWRGREWVLPPVSLLQMRFYTARIILLLCIYAAPHMCDTSSMVQMLCIHHGVYVG